MVGFSRIWWDMDGIGRIWLDMVGYGGTWWDMVGQPLQSEPQGCQSWPKVSQRRPQGTQRAPKRHPKGIQKAPRSPPRNLTNKQLKLLAPGTQKGCQKAPKITKISSNTTPSIHQFFQRIPTTFFVTFSRPPGCLDLLKHCACHAFRGISEILKFTFFNEKVL